MTWVPLTPCGSYRPAFSKPRDFRSAIRPSACSIMSSLLPKTMAPVGQTLAHAGSWPTATRSEHKVHLYALLSFLEMRGILKGHPETQYPQPMQFSSWKSTMPLVNWTTAPGEGHAFRQPGSSQCMQPSFRISHSRSPAEFSYSANRINVQEFSVRSSGLS